MKRLFQFTGLIVWIATAIWSIIYLMNNYEIIRDIFQIVGIVTVSCGVIFLITRTLLGRFWGLEVGKSLFIGSDLVKSIENFLNETPNPSKPTIANLIGHIVYRFTRLGLLGLLLTSVPIILLWQQNRLFDFQNQKVSKQTELFKNQNELVKTQIKLLEADRRSSLNFLLGNLLDQISRELEDKSNPSRSLSEATIGRIAGLSQSFRPYYYLEGDSLTSELLSPERGQLLIALVNSNLNKNTYDNIFEFSDFSAAELSNTNFEDAYLNGVNLTRANFESANLSRATLTGSFLVDANMTNSQLIGTKFFNCYLMGANLRRANMSGSIVAEANFREVQLDSVNFTAAFIYRTDFTNVTGFSNKSARNARAIALINGLHTIEGLDVDSIPERLLREPTYFPDVYEDYKKKSN